MEKQNYTPRERDIIEKCLTISAWNYRVGKLEHDGKFQEAENARKRVKAELAILRNQIQVMLMEMSPSSPPLKITQEHGFRVFCRKFIPGL